MVNLNELDASEFFDVYREFFPLATREEFEQAWAEFQEFKAGHQQRTN